MFRFSAIIITVVTGLTLCLAVFVMPAQAAPPQDKYVRTAVPYMKQVSSADYQTLARYDLIILPVELQLNGPTIFEELRKRNTDIVLLAYVPTKSFITGWGDSLHLKLKAGIVDGWWLKDSGNSTISVWPGTQALSATTDWNRYLPQFVHDNILSTGLWDGIFYDEVSGDIAWVNNGNVDLNHDGARDLTSEADNAWKQGMTTLLSGARALDPEKIFVINGSSTPEFQRYVNGRMFESFPTPWEANGDWSEIMRRYTATETQVSQPETFVINANTANTGNSGDYRKVRYGLVSTLLGGGYYSFDYGDQDHGQMWWYDEYDVYLGKAAGAPKNLDKPEDATWRSSVWQRDYQNGLVLVNSTSSARTVKFSSEYEKLRGTQDPAVNDGSIVSSVTINPKDGLVMLRPLDELSGASYMNGSYARIFNAKGEATRTGFFAYDGRFRGSTYVYELDADADSRLETFVADMSKVHIYNSDSSERLSFAPFGDKWKTGMEIAIADVDGDLTNEIIVGAGPGGAPQVKIFSLAGKEEKSFLAYGATFRGGVHVAAANITGDATAEIVTGAGVGGGPHVRIFDGKGILKSQFFAYDQKFKGGVYVAAGDVMGSGHAQVITGAGFGGGPHVRIYDPAQKNALIGQFFAFDTKLRSGVRVAVSDTDGNGRAEIFGTSTDVFTVTSVGTPAPNPEPVPTTPQVSAPAEPVEEEPASASTLPEMPLFLGYEPLF